MSWPARAFLLVAAVLAGWGQLVAATRPLRQGRWTAVAARARAPATATCGPAPELDGEKLDKMIAGNTGVLIIGQKDMRCTKEAIAALDSKGIKYDLKEFTGDFADTEGKSAVWDWLHKCYPDDKEGGTVMHSYVFQGADFIGQGFAAAKKLQGDDDDDDGDGEAGGGEQSCQERFPDKALVVERYMGTASNKVLLFGWLGCPCTSIARSRLSEEKVCFEGRTWADPDSDLMKYLQCKEGSDEHHSFIYFRLGGGDQEWAFEGNGFAFESREMSEEELRAKIAAAGAATTCEQANIKVNMYGGELEECRADSSDASGSWMDDGTCTEEAGGVHQVCIENLPADFSTETHQPPWSKDRTNMRHCVCIGAWSLYMTDSAKHTTGATEIMPHCKAIPETALTTNYLQKWKVWNGYPANIVHGVKELVSRCLVQADDPKLKCGLKARFAKMAEEVNVLQTSEDLEEVRTELNELSCD